MLTSPPTCWARGSVKTETFWYFLWILSLAADLPGAWKCICRLYFDLSCPFILQMCCAIHEQWGLQQPLPGPGAWRLSEPVSAGAPESKCSLFTQTFVEFQPEHAPSSLQSLWICQSNSDITKEKIQTTTWGLFLKEEPVGVSVRV